MATKIRRLAPMEFVAASYGTTGIGVETKTGYFDGIKIDEADSVVSAVVDINGQNVTSILGLGAGVLLDTTVLKRHSSVLTSVTFTAGKGTLINAKP